MQPAMFFEPEPVPGLPGPAGGPKGPKIGQKPGARLCDFIPPKGGGTLDGNKNNLKIKERESIIFGVWAAPGAPETLPKNEGQSPQGLRGPRGRPDPKKWPTADP